MRSISTIEKMEPVVNAGSNPRLGVTGLILAKLVDNPHYSLLKEKYRKLVKGWIDTESELERAISFLDNCTTAELIEMSNEK